MVVIVARSRLSSGGGGDGSASDVSFCPCPWEKVLVFGIQVPVNITG